MPKGIRINWAPFEEFLRANYREYTARELSAMLQEQYGAEISGDAISNYLQRHNLHSGRTGRFEPGRTAENKGRTWAEYMPPASQAQCRATTFKKGNHPQTYVPVGTEVIDGGGYRKRKVADPNRWQFVHRMVWEQHFGPIPAGHVVAFRDGDKANRAPENLVLLSRAENAVRNRHLIQLAETPEQHRAVIALAKLKTEISRREKEDGNDGNKKHGRQTGGKQGPDGGDAPGPGGRSAHRTSAARSQGHNTGADAG